MVIMRRLTRSSNHSIFFFFFFSIFSSSHLPLCPATDTIISSQSLTGDQTIVSAGNNFVLGFFSPGNSTNRYIGIWYKKVSPLIYVWVANKDNPLPPSSTGILRFGEDGSLNLVDETTGKIYWSTNTTHGSQANTSIATLLDSGNLIITREDGKTKKTHVWQSFDYPSDVLIPGMKIGLNRKSGESWILKSWVDINNPSIGGFDLGIGSESESINQLMIMERGVKHWRSGPWNGERFDGVLEMNRNNSIYNYSLVSEGDEIYFTYSIYDHSVISMMMLDATGKVQQLTWEEEHGTWVLLWAHPGDQCEVYGFCGAFGYCRSGPSCDCLPGFRSQPPEKWIPGDWSGGCSRKTELQCGQVDKFLEVEGMRLPDGFTKVVGSNLDECEDACIRNCSCIAYAIASGARCLVWSGSLMDLEEVAVEGHDLFIRIDGSELDGTRKWMLVMIIVATTIGIFFIHYWMWRDAKERGPWKESKVMALSDLGATSNNSIHAKNLGDGIENDPHLPLFDFACVETATQDFSHANKLGEGGFGPVYKGVLPDGEEMAVKRLSRRSGQGLKEFMNEVVLLSKLHHVNLVRVLGCCIQGEEKILIYEYMPNKSLDYFLSDPNKRAILDWVKSFHIIEGIAQGLLYLHQYSRLRIIHRDLKASNVLLDGEMKPKISDFGMARIFEGNQTQANTTKVAGTYGYMAPEYALDGRFSVKSDVFSFGVLLLEIIRGERINGFYHFEQSLNLLGYAWELWKGGRSFELLDPSMGNSYPTREVSRCIHIGLLCVQEDAKDRPTMSSIVLMLSTEDVALPEPKRPAFSVAKNPTDIDSSSMTSRSINEVTLTVSEGR